MAKEQAVRQGMEQPVERVPLVDVTVTTGLSGLKHEINSKFHGEPTDVLQVLDKVKGHEKRIQDAIKKLDEFIPDISKGKNVVWISDLRTWLRDNNYPDPDKEYSRLMNEGAAGFHLSGGGHNNDVFLIGEHHLYAMLAGYDNRYSTDLFARVVAALIYHEILHASLGMDQHKEIMDKTNKLLDRLYAQAHGDYTRQKPGVTEEYLRILQGVVRDQYRRASVLPTKANLTRR